MKALVGAFNQEKALVGAFSVIVQPVVEPMEHYTALITLLSGNVLCITYRVRSLASVYAGHHPRMSNPATPGCDGPVNEFAQHGRRLETVSSLSLIHRRRMLKSHMIDIHISRRHYKRRCLVQCARRHAGLQLPRLKRLRDHAGARLRQVSTRLQVVRDGAS